MSPVPPMLLLLGLSLPLIACGGSDTGTETSADPGASETTAISRAAEETLDAGSARVALAFEWTGSNRTLGNEVGERDTFEAVADFREHLVSFESPLDRAVVDESALYLSHQGGRWRRYDLVEEPKGEYSPDWYLGRLDPIRLLAFASRIEDAGALFETVGQDRVRGVAATHYRGYAEVRALMRELVPEQAYEKLVWPVNGSSEVPFDAWVGEDGRLLKVVYDFPPFDTLAGDRSTVEFHDFGTEVDIEVPDDTVTG